MSAEGLTQFCAYSTNWAQSPAQAFGIYKGARASSQPCKSWCLEHEGATSPPSPSQLIYNIANQILFEDVSEFKDLAVVNLSATEEALMTTSWVKRLRLGKTNRSSAWRRLSATAPVLGVVWDLGSERDVPGSLSFYCGDDPAHGCLMHWDRSEKTRRRIQKH